LGSVLTQCAVSVCRRKLNVDHEARPQALWLVAWQPRPGTVPPEEDPELRLIRRAPRSPLADSYRSQQYHFRDEGNRYLLTPEPYGSTAIHAAALWRAHRKVALALLGCGPCADGSERIWGSPRGGTISLAEEIIGSRYGGYTWRP